MFVENQRAELGCRLL